MEQNLAFYSLGRFSDALNLAHNANEQGLIAVQLAWTSVVTG